MNNMGNRWQPDIVSKIIIHSNSLFVSFFAQLYVWLERGNKRNPKPDRYQIDVN